MATTRIELRPNRDLINSDFDGYKLSLDPLPTYKTEINGDVSIVKLNEAQFSFQHHNTFANHNHLYSDPWNNDHVYYVTKNWSVQLVKASEDSGLDTPLSVFTIPRKVPTHSGHYNISMKFTQNHAILADGTGFLYVVLTGDRSSSTSWKEVFCSNECVDKMPFLILDSCSRDCSSIDCLLMHIEEKSTVKWLNDDSENMSFVVIVEWITLSLGDGDVWKVTRTRRLGGFGSIYYAALEKTCQGVCVVSEKPFIFGFDSVQSLDLNEHIPKSNPATKEPAKLYAWIQTPNDISLWIAFDDTVSKKDIDFKLTSSHVCVALKDRSTFMDGTLFSSVDVDGSTWTWQENKIEISLTKASPGLIWPELIKGDSFGQEIANASLIPEILKNLQHLNPEEHHFGSQAGQFHTSNPQQLEECDDFPLETFKLLRFDGESHQITQEVNLSSHQWLFSTVVAADEYPAFCVRHDVDGLVWQPSNTSINWTCNHISTFNALGYVIASKQDRKFLNCPPNSTFVVLCDSRLHMYIYYQPMPIASELHNRKTRKHVKNIAKQHVVTLDQSNVWGLHVSNENIFVLTNESLYFVKALSAIQ